MKLNNFWEKNKTWIVVLLIIVGAYLVITPVGMFNANQFYSGAESSYSKDVATGSGGMDSYRGIAPSPTYSDASQYYPEEQRKVEKNAYATLEVEPMLYDSAKVSLDGIAGKYSGYYTDKSENKNAYGDKEYRVFTITIKVPVDKFENAIADLRNVAEVKSLSQNANDMTTQYYDMKAYLDNYKKEKETLLALYNKAIQIDDIIKIQERISQVQSQIDSYQMQLNNIERMTDYSTIRVTMSEKRDQIEGYYEMTGIKQLWGNVIRSFDNVFVTISNLVGFAVAVLILLLGYKVAKRIFKF